MSILDEGAQEAVVVWRDADESPRDVKAHAMCRLNGDRTVDLEVLLPFGELGGRLTVRLGEGLLREIVRHMTGHVDYGGNVS